jgi:hypothetical protein
MSKRTPQLRDRSKTAFKPPTRYSSGKRLQKEDASAGPITPAMRRFSKKTLEQEDASARKSLQQSNPSQKKGFNK